MECKAFEFHYTSIPIPWDGYMLFAMRPTASSPAEQLVIAAGTPWHESAEQAQALVLVLRYPSTPEHHAHYTAWERPDYFYIATGHTGHWSHLAERYNMDWALVYNYINTHWAELPSGAVIDMEAIVAGVPTPLLPVGRLL